MKEAISKLLQKDENGEYEMDKLYQSSEREYLTELVRILNEINLNKANDKDFENLRKALGMIGAYDRYGYLRPQEKIDKMSEFYEKCNNGDMVPAKMFVSKFFGKMDLASRALLEEKFSNIMSLWIKKSDEMINGNKNVSMAKYARYALELDIGSKDVGDEGNTINKNENVKE